MSFRRIVPSLAALFLLTWTAHAQITDAISHQSELRDGGVPVTDLCDFRLTLWEADLAGAQLELMIDLLDQSVLEGRITADLDFGDNLFGGNGRWIEIEVHCPGGSGTYTFHARHEEPENA